MKELQRDIISIQKSLNLPISSRKEEIRSDRTQIIYGNEQNGIKEAQNTEMQRENVLYVFTRIYYDE